MLDFDIAIIGGGPAGATLARLLDKRFRVLMIDEKTDAPESFHKPCGGLLSPDAQKAFAEFDLTLPKEVLVDPQIFSVRTIDLGKRLERHYQRFYINLDRHKFDLWLKGLIPKNVVLVNGRCLEITKNGDFAVICSSNGEKRVFTAAKIVGADGAKSMVRRLVYPNKKIRSYTAIQQWFPENSAKPFYSCIFDPETSDCCSWTISKDNFLIYGGAFPAKNCRHAFERQKKRLEEYGIPLGEPIKTEACIVLRPKSPFDICAGKNNAFLVGEAAGLISPSSLEGISFAVNSAKYLAEALNGGINENIRYSRGLLKYRAKIFVKLLKCPFMYAPFLRRIVMKSGLKSITISHNMDNISVDSENPV